MKLFSKINWAEASRKIKTRELERKSKITTINYWLKVKVSSINATSRVQSNESRLIKF